MPLVALVVLVVGASHAYFLRLDFAGSATMYLGIGLPYLLLGSLTLHHLWSEGTLSERLTPRWGDVGLGGLLGLGLVGASWVVREQLLPATAMERVWVLRLFAQIGDSKVIQSSLTLTLLLFSVALLEELVWRGLVLGQLEQRFGLRRGWILTALLYAASLLPAMWATRVEPVGLNPLLPLAALGCGLVWSFTAARLGRLPPVLISHAVFTYFAGVVFRVPGS
ncbi:MAG: CPBP family intramembrane metalloprotease [Polyangiaceae bacterium]|nr:CPBP family intramembrane metalloprotease [Polyangiaceae bacterium]MCW5791996.1 CPBP family intramembrane metalloprotease [Polyangiaceae bacterium]